MAVNREMNVLVVDDYTTMIRIVRNLLDQLGFKNVDSATSGETALRMVKSKPYGLILSDWNMQPMTGLELLKSIRSDPQIASVPFVMVTAESKVENVVAARKAGANQYIVKPFTAAVLRQKLSTVLGEIE